MMIIKLRTPLGSRIRKYYQWKTNNSRHIMMSFIQPSGMIKIKSCSSCEDLSKRRDIVLTEWISLRIMDLEIKQNGL